MAYATGDMIASEAKIGTSFSADTLPSADKVDEIIAEVEALIDAKIGRKYELPVAGASNLLVVRAISIALCVERVRGIIDSSAPAQEKENEPLRDARAGGRTARKQLDEIVDGTIPLAGQTLKSSTDGIRSYAVSNGLEPVFERGKTQW